LVAPMQSVFATLCYNLGPLPHTLIGSCPGHPDHVARRCPDIGVAGTSPAMTV
jgi:hypothetical protein